MTDPETLLAELQRLLRQLQGQKMAVHKRRVSVGDLLTERDAVAREYGFGEGTTCYDNVLVIGNVIVGRNTRINTNVILDGSGGLEIGDYCSISAGVHIYTHDTVAWSLSMGEAPPERAPARIGSGVYIGPNTIISMGVTIGDRAVIGAMSFVNRDIPPLARAWGCPARVVSTSV